MAVFKCKMCGGTLAIQENQSVALCEYCGTKQTLPKLDDERRNNLYDRANHFRRCNEFDKAEAIYEQILIEDNTDAEAYWSLILCKYGIEYVEDSQTHSRIPTVRRTQFTSIFADEDYQMALKYADSNQRILYEEEAEVIDGIQKELLKILSQEEPFDVFICYKDSDAVGARTIDSVLAQDIYYQLTENNLKVFFSRITLEGKEGRPFEPYIFAALNSAKVMVIVGTKSEYLNSAWVKNEWSRFLKLAQNDKSRLIIPAYKDMNPYDWPDALSCYQAYDMSKIGFVQDLIRGIKKVLEGTERRTEKGPESYLTESGLNVSALLKRGNMALEDSEWDKAFDFFEQVLNTDAECSEAYLGQALAREHVDTVQAFFNKRLNLTQEAVLTPHELQIEQETYQQLKEKVQNNFLRRNLLDEVNHPIVYNTLEEGRTKQYEEEQEVINNKFLSKALRFAAEESEVKKELNIFLQEMTKRISEAKENDAETLEKVSEQARDLVRKTEENIEKALQKKEEVYEEAYRRYLHERTKYTPRQIYDTFCVMGNYKDAKKICNEIVEEYERNIEQLIEKEETLIKSWSRFRLNNNKIMALESEIDSLQTTYRKITADSMVPSWVFWEDGGNLLEKRWRIWEERHKKNQEILEDYQFKKVSRKSSGKDRISTIVYTIVPPLISYLIITLIISLLIYLLPGMSKNYSFFENYYNTFCCSSICLGIVIIISKIKGKI